MTELNPPVDVVENFIECEWKDLPQNSNLTNVPTITRCSDHRVVNVMLLDENNKEYKVTMFNIIDQILMLSTEAANDASQFLLFRTHTAIDTTYVVLSGSPHDAVSICLVVTT